MTNYTSWKRRRFLVLTGGITVLAGCSADGDDDESGNESESDEEGNQTDEEGDEETDEISEDNEDEEDPVYTVTIHVENHDGEPIERAQVEFVHDDAIVFDTREDRETNEEGEVTFETEGGSVDVTVEAEAYQDNDVQFEVDSDEERTISLIEEEEETDEEEEEETDEEEEEETDEEEESAGEESNDTDESLSDEEAKERFHDETGGQDIELDRFTADEMNNDHSVGIEYYLTEQGIEWEIRELTRIYFDLLEDGYESDWLHGIRVDGDMADWYVDDEWVDQYLSEEMTFEEVVTQTVDTVERIDEGVEEPDEEVDEEATPHPF